MNPVIVSVSELNSRARGLLEQEFPLLWVAGEVSNLTRAASGHFYFNLKDETAQVRCVMFRSRAAVIPWRLANGQQVEARALPTLYEPRGEFQLGVESLRRAGLGRLYEAFARLRQQLEAEGLFAAERKRPLPTFPRRVGIVSSPQAAALQDVLAALRRRAPRIETLLYATPVQGEEAPPGIVQAIGLAARQDRADVLLLVRGGGSIEDLWAFNDEAVARAIAASPIPVISGVGHESDITIADLVADMRAATPTAAAEVATANWVEAGKRLREAGRRLEHGMERQLARWRQRVDELELRLVHPAVRLTRSRDRLSLLATRLHAVAASALYRARSRTQRLAARLSEARPDIESRRSRLAMASHRGHSAAFRLLEGKLAHLSRAADALAHLNPAATMTRGYAIVRDGVGEIVSNAARLNAGDQVGIQFAIGEATARIETTQNIPMTTGPVARSPIPD